MDESLLGVQRLRDIVRCVALRRPKSTIVLPQRNDEVQLVHLNEGERQRYFEIEASAKSLMDNAIHTGSGGSATYLSALQRINSLRMMCNLGLTYCYPSSLSLTPQSWNEQAARKHFDNMASTGIAICSACSLDLGLCIMEKRNVFESGDKIYLTKCVQLFCNECFTASEARDGGLHNLCKCTVRCPYYRLNLETVGDNAATPSSSQFDESIETSSKVESVVESIKNQTSGEKRSDYDFSLLRTVLIHIQRHLFILDNHVRSHRQSNER